MTGKTLMLLSLAGVLSAQLRVTYDLSAAPEALTIHTFNEPGFVQSLDRFGAGLDLAPVSPLILRIRNNGPRKIGFLNVRYTYTFPDGSERFGDIQHNRNPGAGDQFEPGHEILIYPAMTRVGNDVTGTSVADLRQLIGLMGRCVEIRVTVDAVTFDDGELRGRDLGGIARRYRAERAALQSAVSDSTFVATHWDDEAFASARQHVAGLSPQAIRELLAHFPPLKGDNQQ